MKTMFSRILFINIFSRSQDVWDPVPFYISVFNLIIVILA